MQQVLLKIVKNVPLTENVYKMTLCGDVSDIVATGQFVNIKLDGMYLRRPISVCDCEGDLLTIIYKVVGKGRKIVTSVYSFRGFIVCALKPKLKSQHRSSRKLGEIFELFVLKAVGARCDIQPDNTRQTKRGFKFFFEYANRRICVGMRLKIHNIAIAFPFFRQIYAPVFVLLRDAFCR